MKGFVAYLFLFLNYHQVDYHLDAFLCLSAFANVLLKDTILFVQ